jgi:hypothetical protein
MAWSKGDPFKVLLPIKAWSAQATKSNSTPAVELNSSPLSSASPFLHAWASTAADGDHHPDVPAAIAQQDIQLDGCRLVSRSSNAVSDQVVLVRSLEPCSYVSYGHVKAYPCKEACGTERTA